MQPLRKPIDNIMFEARVWVAKGLVPSAAYGAFRSHRDKAKSRGIEFLLRFPEWWVWWQIDSRWEKRGCKRNNLVMARINDIGPYSLDNIYCATSSKNVSDYGFSTRHKEVMKKFWATRKQDPNWLCPLKVRGDGHPSSKPVITPLGRFGSAALAAEEFGISRQEASRRARLGIKGWKRERPDPVSA